MTRVASSIGKAVDLAAAAVFAAAVAFALSALASGALAALTAPLAFIAVYLGLGRVSAGPLHAFAPFVLVPIDAPQPAAGEAADDNVVRLFDPRQVAIARPSAASRGGVPEDAGQALSDALAQLKRSLR